MHRTDWQRLEEEGIVKDSNLGISDHNLCFASVRIKSKGSTNVPTNTLFYYPSARAQRDELHAAACAYTTTHFLLAGPGAFGWRDLSISTQHKLLLGNIPPTTLFTASSLTDTISNSDFVQGLVAATMHHVHAILKHRTALARAQQQQAAAGQRTSAAPR